MNLIMLIFKLYNLWQMLHIYSFWYFSIWFTVTSLYYTNAIYEIMHKLFKQFKIIIECFISGVHYLVWRRYFIIGQGITALSSIICIHYQPYQTSHGVHYQNSWDVEQGWTETEELLATGTEGIIHKYYTIPL